LKFLDFGEDGGTIVFVDPWEDMGGCHDGPYPIMITDSTHFDGLFNGLCPIIQSAEYMSVEIDHLNGFLP
jgi:hypothetical protein